MVKAEGAHIAISGSLRDDGVAYAGRTRIESGEPRSIRRGAQPYLVDAPIFIEPAMSRPWPINPRTGAPARFHPLN